MITTCSSQAGRRRWIVWAVLVGALVALPAITPAANRQNPETISQTADTPDQDETSPSAPEQVSELPTDLQTGSGSAAKPTAQTIQTGNEQTQQSNASTTYIAKDPTTYDLLVLLPAVIAIVLAIFTRQVVPALFVGVLVGAYMMVPCMAAGDAFANLPSLVSGFRLAAERYIMGAVTDPGSNYGHISIIVFTLIIGFTVGVIGHNGGTEGMVRLVAGKTNSPRRVGLTAWAAGLFVFFDDYSNTMIVGPTMRSVFDRVKLSRAKLAYIVDSTAAPVASIALIGTWVGAEIGYIQDGLKEVAAGAGGAPAFLIDSGGHLIDGWEAFVYSIPYRFYPILALVLVFLIVVTGRDFGPMKRSERKALSKIDPDAPSPDADAPTTEKVTPRWWLGLLPIIVLIVATMVVLALTGYQGAGGESVLQSSDPWWRKAADIAGAGDSYLSIYYGALLSAISAIILTMLARACPLGEAIDAGVEGMVRMFPAMVILVLAWALSGVLQDLKLGDVVVAHLREINFPPVWLPLAIFISAAGISFATGTSWGTMGILCPFTVEIGARLMVDMNPPEALNLFYASIGSVLAGAVFGDHCSPISDTTVLSSIAAGCRHEEHVWTQIPYALLAAVAAMGLGDVMCSVYHQPWYFGLGAGIVSLVLVVYVIGRRPSPSFELADG